MDIRRDQLTLNTKELGMITITKPIITKHTTMERHNNLHAKLQGFREAPYCFCETLMVQCFCETPTGCHKTPVVSVKPLFTKQIFCQEMNEMSMSTQKNHGFQLPTPLGSGMVRGQFTKKKHLLRNE